VVVRVRGMVVTCGGGESEVHGGDVLVVRVRGMVVTTARVWR
jgi:hypothetical protein